MDKNGKELSRYFNLTNQRRKEEEQFAKKKYIRRHISLPSKALKSIKTKENANAH